MPKLPKFKTEEQFAKFVDTHDTAPYWNDMPPVDPKQFRFMGAESQKRKKSKQGRAASKSDAQKSAEEAAIRELAGQLGVALVPRPLSLSECNCCIDGYHEQNGKVILAEAWAHIGKAKSAQRNKVLTDVLKLALASQLLRDQRPDCRVETYMVFIDKEASLVLSGRSWASAAAKEFSILPKVVQIEPKLMDRVREAQHRQDLRNKE